MIEIVVLLLLLIIAIVDAKTKKIPSILLSGVLLVVAFVNIKNLSFGVLSLFYAWFLLDANFIKGMGDVKVIGIIGFMINSSYFFMIFLFLVVFLGAIYSWALIYIMKKTENSEIPFIPVLSLVYITLLILQGGWLWIVG